MHQCVGREYGRSDPALWQVGLRPRNVVELYVMCEHNHYHNRHTRVGLIAGIYCAVAFRVVILNRTSMLNFLCTEPEKNDRSQQPWFVHRRLYVNAIRLFSVTRNCKHRRAAAKLAACAKHLMLSTVGRKGKKEGG